MDEIYRPFLFRGLDPPAKLSLINREFGSIFASKLYQHVLEIKRPVLREYLDSIN